MNNKKLSIGTRLYLSVLALFLVFAVAFILFQQYREKQYKIDTLELRLQDFNNQAHDALQYGSKDAGKAALMSAFLKNHIISGIRVTVIDDKGWVVFDNIRKNYRTMSNHLRRPEVAEAMSRGMGSTVERNSTTLGQDYFYSATYYPKDRYIIRSALPYNVDLAKNLQTDQHYIWFAVAVLLLLTLVLYRFTHRLGGTSRS